MLKIDQAEANRARYGARARTQIHRGLAALATTLIIGLGAGSAQAVSIFEGDQTSVLLTSFFALRDLGISVEPVGTAVIGDDVVRDQNNGEFRKLAVFPITGGGINSVTGEVIIEHDQSGLELKLEDTSVFLLEFVIELVGTPVGDGLGSLFATVDLGTGPPLENFELFAITACGLGVTNVCLDSDGSAILNGFRLALTGAAAEALNFAFDSDAFVEGLQFGVARVDVRVVPEPGTFALVALGLAGLSFAGRRRES